MFPLPARLLGPFLRLVCCRLQSKFHMCVTLIDPSCNLSSSLTCWVWRPALEFFQQVPLCGLAHRCRWPPLASSGFCHTPESGCNWGWPLPLLASWVSGAILTCPARHLHMACALSSVLCPLSGDLAGWLLAWDFGLAADCRAWER